MELDYSPLGPDEQKLMGKSIDSYKTIKDSTLRKKISRIYRHEKLICIMSGHFKFREAKKEEDLRLKSRPKPKKKQSTKKAQKKIKKPTTETEKKLVDKKEEKPEWKTGKRIKMRHAVPKEESVEIKVYHEVNYHGEPVVPKKEPIDWVSFPIPDLNIPLPTKNRTSRKKKKPTLPSTRAISKSSYCGRIETGKG
ncbi:hypothetical protein AgCh_021871 [Apium graveolens]